MTTEQKLLDDIKVLYKAGSDVEESVEKAIANFAEPKELEKEYADVGLDAYKQYLAIKFVCEFKGELI